MRGEQAGLDVKDPALADLVAEERVGDLDVHPAFVGSEHALASCARQADTTATYDEALAATSPLLINPSTTLSPISGLNSSAKSRARAGRPNRGRW